ncbi:MAG: carboxypeptidase-like regulatory domain-containing protein [Candidatus Cloacimonetes bacterium]|nr:carboxypeptidase-like regulatory domain-containing protein [Candidatus Cloacimonadota bacterium]
METFYSNSIIFSVQPLPEVNLRIGNDYIAETDINGRYRFQIGSPGEYYLFAEKSGYLGESSRLDLIKGDKILRDFYLPRVNEDAHGWFRFPATSDGGQVNITADGLCIFSRGRDHVYATKVISVPNNRTYRFIANMKKDPNTQYIYFGVQPQIAGYEWKEDYINLDGWRISEIDYHIFDTTTKEVSYIFDEAGNVLDTVNLYPENVNVVLKIGVQLGTNYPLGFFREIRIEN